MADTRAATDLGISLLMAHVITGGDAQVSLPSFAPALAVVTAIEWEGAAARRSATAAAPPGS